MAANDVVFIGSGAWGHAALSSLLRCDAIRVALVVTDAASYAQLSTTARGHDVRVFESWECLADQMASTRLGVCAGWKRIPRAIFDLPEIGFVNVHGSLLPRYRGPEPLERQYLDGLTEVGVTIHRIAEQIDAGAVYAQKTTTLSPFASLKDCMMKLTLCAAGLVKSTVPSIVDATFSPSPQSDVGASQFPFLTPAEGYVSLDLDPVLVFRKIACLGVRGWARVEHNGTRFVVHSPVLVEREYTGPLDIEVTHDRATMLIKSPPFVIQAAVHSFESMRSTKSSQPSSGEYVNG
jgi:methionyl-tRNA formyltransferase